MNTGLLEPVAKASAAPTTKRVLIVEDDRLLARIYWKKLLMAGYSTEIAPDGLAGLKMVGEFQPDLVLLDLMMPGMNGVEVLTRLRSEATTQQLPVIVFSSVLSGDLIDQARRAGATRFLSKSDGTPDRLLEEIAELIGPSTSAAIISGVPAPRVVPELTPREKFLRAAVTLATDLRRMQAAFFLRGSGDLSKLTALLQHAKAIQTQGTAAGFPLPAHTAGALAAYLQDLDNQPLAITPAAQHTIEKAVKCLAALVELREQPTECDFSGVNVLAVDDDPVALRMTTHALSLVRLRVECLSNPLIALEVLARRTFDLVLLDLEMPEMSGMKLCAHLRQLPANANTPVIFATGVNEFERREEALSYGADDLIAKPFLSTELAVKALTYLLTARG